MAGSQQCMRKILRNKKKITFFKTDLPYKIIMADLSVTHICFEHVETQGFALLAQQFSDFCSQQLRGKIGKWKLHGLSLYNTTYLQGVGGLIYTNVSVNTLQYFEVSFWFAAKGRPMEFHETHDEFKVCYKAEVTDKRARCLLKWVSTGLEDKNSFR